MYELFSAFWCVEQKFTIKNQFQGWRVFVYKSCALISQGHTLTLIP